MRTTLSRQQKTVLDLARLGLSNREIGHRLQIATGTVKVHLQICRRKLGTLQLGRRNPPRLKLLEAEIARARDQFLLACSQFDLGLPDQALATCKAAYEHLLTVALPQNGTTSATDSPLS